MTTLLGEIFLIAPGENLEAALAAGGGPPVTREIFHAALGRTETLVFIHMMPFGPWSVGGVVYDTAPLEISFPYADYWLPRYNFPINVVLLQIPGTDLLAYLVVLVTEE